MSELTNKLKTEHQEIYQQLDTYLHQLTKLKNQRDDEHLMKTCKALLAYVQKILSEHFTEEEEQLFPLIDDKSLLTRLTEDHHDIRNKYLKVLTAYKNFNSETQDYKQELLFPAYNLIATINHHAAREDSQLFN